MNTPAAEAILGRATPPPGTSSFFQVGYVVPDLQNALDFFSERLKAQPFLVMKDAQLSDQTFHGEPFSPRQDLAFGYAGDLQFELIHPIDGGDESVYTRFLDRNPDGGIHHTAVRVDDLDRGVVDIGAKPEDVVQTGRFGRGTRFGYVDVTSNTGALIELIQIDDDTLVIFDRLRRGELP